MSRCDFVSDAELNRWFAGTLDDNRHSAIRVHAEGCDICLMLLADAATFAEVLADGVREEEAREFAARAEFVAAHLARRAEPRRRGLRTWAWGLAAAAALALAVLGLSDLWSPAPGLRLADGSPVVFEALPFSAPPDLRGEPSLRERWQGAGEAYAVGRWEQAAREFAALRETMPESADAALYHGVSLLKADRFAEAATALDAARRLAEAQGLPVTAADWFAGLAALGTDDLPGARDRLGRAAAGQGRFAESARNLLQRIEN